VPASYITHGRILACNGCWYFQRWADSRKFAVLSGIATAEMRKRLVEKKPHLVLALHSVYCLRVAEMLSGIFAERWTALLLRKLMLK